MACLTVSHYKMDESPEWTLSQHTHAELSLHHTLGDAECNLSANMSYDPSNPTESFVKELEDMKLCESKASLETMHTVHTKPSCKIELGTENSKDKCCEVLGSCALV
jgi:hypothetical protein